MVKAREPRLYPQHLAWQASELNFMSTTLQPRQQESLPACINPGICVSSAHVALPGVVVPGIPDLKTGQTNEAHGLLQSLPLHLQSLLPTPNPYHKEKQSVLCYGLDGKAVPNANSGSSPTRFLIFDQCGNQTRLIYNSGFPPVQNPTTATSPICCYNVVEKEQVDGRGRIDPSKYFLHEESGENKITRDESEFHEDTEEINALLYSDDNYDDEDDSEDDEVASTGHSPSYEKHEYDEFVTEEDAGLEGLNKRQKLLNGGYKQSLPVDTASSVNLDRSLEYDSDAESGYAIGQNQGEEAGSILGKMCFKRDRVRQTLRILESIIPGAEGKDPLLVIDEAIDYLKILKLKAKSLGVSHQ